MRITRGVACVALACGLVTVAWARRAPAQQAGAGPAGTGPATTQPEDVKYDITVDPEGLSEDMKAWANGKLLDTCKEWYPKLVADLPSPGFKAPQKVTIRFRPDSEMKGTPAYTAGTAITCNVEWYTKQKEGEAVGATIHELVHVVQQYRFGRRTPGWLQEGIPDYLRWYTFEPEKHGCVIRKVTKDTNYDKSYRTSANFLDWATLTYDKDLVMKLNEQLRQGKYTPGIWPKLCKGKTVDQLNAEWKAAITAGTAESNK